MQPESSKAVRASLIPLQNIDILADVVGSVAQVVMTQRYGNHLEGPVEAKFVFPLPADAQVEDVQMQIGRRRITSRIRERQQATEAYEDARDAGHHAVLVEQERENIFTASVAGIEPGEQIEVVMTFSMPVLWQGGGRFILPLTVAPRFIPGTPIGHAGTGTSPDTDEVPDASRVTPPVVVDVPYRASIEILLTPGFDAQVSSPSHPDVVSEGHLPAGTRLRIRALDIAPDRDFIVVYETCEKQPTIKVDRTLFTPSEGPVESFVTLQLMAGRGTPPVYPADIVLLLDVSGSMQGAKLDGLKRVTTKVLDRLSSLDLPPRVGIVVFSNDPMERVRLSPIGDEHRQTVGALVAGGGTYTGKALTRVMQMFGEATDDRERSIILISDGQTDSRTFQANPGVRIHGIGLDSAVNDAFLKSVARETGGGNAWLRPGESFDGAARLIAGMALGPVLRSVELVGLPREAEVVGLADLYTDQPTTIVIRSREPIGSFRIAGRNIDGTSIEHRVQVPDEETSRMGARLWARNRIRELVDARQQTELSSRYGVLGPTTAFVVIATKEQPGEAPVQVVVPTMLPDTWEMGRQQNLGASHLRRMAESRPTNQVLYSFADKHGGPMIASAVPAAMSASPVRRRTRGGGSQLMKGAAPAAYLSGDSLGDSATRGMAASVDLSDAKDGIDDVEEVAEAFVAPLGSSVNMALKAETPPALKTAEELHTALTIGSTDTAVDAIRLRFKHELEEAEGAKFTGWSELDRARIYLLIVTLRVYGFIFAVADALQFMPCDADAYRLWAKARRLLGQPTTQTQTL